MTPADTRPDANLDLTAEIAGEFLALADLLEAAPPQAWDAPSLCEGWRTREVVAHMTMPARYDGARFMERLAAAGGDFTAMSDAVAAEDGALPLRRCSRTCAPRRCTPGSRQAAGPKARSPTA